MERGDLRFLPDSPLTICCSLFQIKRCNTHTGLISSDLSIIMKGENHSRALAF